MFLRTLKDEQKSLFLALATQAAKVNDIVEEVEKEMLIAYADEMGVPAVIANASDFETCLSQLKAISTKKELNQIMYELVGLMICDTDFDPAEKAFLSKVADVFEISAEKVDVIFKYAQEYARLTRQINLAMLD